VRAGQLVADRYRLEELLGEGGGGAVWRARDERLRRVVAMKRAAVPADGDAERRIRSLLDEAEILAGLNHPNIVTLYDVVSDGSQWWLVMEYVAARSLAHHRRLPPERAARFGAQIAAGLEAVHAAGVIHRDIKPGNVLVTADDQAKLGDFGIARASYADATLTDSGGPIRCTPAYVAPEVARGGGPTPAGDVFSLGATLFAAVEGVSPYGRGNPMALLARAIRGEVAAPGRRAGALAPVLHALMHVDPAKRPTAAQARSMLEDLAKEFARDLAQDPAEDAAGKGVGRRRGLACLTVAVAALVLTAAAWMAIEWWPGTARSTSTAPPSSIADPHKADPCALLDQASLARFGGTELDPASGNFNRCDVYVRPPGGGQVDVTVELLAAEPDVATPWQVERVGGIAIVREPENDGQCHRTVVLRDGVRVDIGAKFTDKGRGDLCAMAEAAAKSAVAKLSGGRFPQRAARPADRSLFWVDACGLLDADALARFPGVDALHPEVGFGNWECRWRSTTSRSQLLVRFDQHVPLTADDGHPTRVGGRYAYVEPDGYGDDTCLVRVLHRRFTLAGQPRTELLLVVVFGLDARDRCRLATDLAGSAAAGLPRT